MSSLFSIFEDNLYLLHSNDNFLPSNPAVISNQSSVCFFNTELHISTQLILLIHKISSCLTEPDNIISSKVESILNNAFLNFSNCSGFCSLKSLDKWINAFSSDFNSSISFLTSFSGYLLSANSLNLTIYLE